MANLQDCINALVQSDRLYLANWVIPYSNAYVAAHTSFKSTLDDQRKYDEMIADISIMALSLGIGAGMAAIFAKAGVTSGAQLVRERALTEICNRNMERAFSAMHSISSSPAGSYLAGQAWSTANGKITEVTKTKVRSLLQPTPLASDLISNPLVARDKLRRYCVLATAAAHDIVADLMQHGNLSAEEENRIANQILAAPIIADRPYTTNLPTNAAKIMELNMFMALILNNDVAETTRGGAVPYGASISTTRQQVSALPSDESYPRPYNNNSFSRNGYSASAHIDNRVIRFRFGSTIWRKINQLHQDLFTGPFYRITSMNGGIGTFQQVVAAEAMSERLQTLVYPNLPAFQATSR